MNSLNLFSNLRHKENPIVFLEISIGGKNIGVIYIELFKDVTPKTAENFRQFCTGEKLVNGVPIGYKSTIFHRVIKGFIIQGGDFVKKDGTGCYSIYGESFRDENFILKHDSAGLLSMANSGPNSNGCQFFITTEECRELDGKHVVFGKVIDQISMSIVRQIENLPVDFDDNPQFEVLVTQCGEM
jgi:peptidyl-prolyl isomerase H (cyclophilin H)